MQMAHVPSKTENANEAPDFRFYADRADLGFSTTRAQTALPDLPQRSHGSHALLILFVLLVVIASSELSAASLVRWWKIWQA